MAKPPPGKLKSQPASTQSLSPGPADNLDSTSPCPTTSDASMDSRTLRLYTPRWIPTERFPRWSSLDESRGFDVRRCLVGRELRTGVRTCGISKYLIIVVGNIYKTICRESINSKTIFCEDTEGRHIPYLYVHLEQRQWDQSLHIVMHFCHSFCLFW